MNITLEDYLENHAFCDYENTEATIRLKIKDSIYFLDQDNFDYFCNDYVKDVEVSIDGNEYGVWLLVVIELIKHKEGVE